MRQSIKSFENWLNRIAELRREVNDETAVEILTVVSEVCYLFWLDNIEYINESGMLTGKVYKNEIPSLDKSELQKLWGYNHRSPYYESILQISSTNINYIQAQQQKNNTYDKEQTG